MDGPTSEAGSRPTAAALWLPLLPHAVFALLMMASWNRWMEPFVDSGRELMVPWRIAQGEALYRDVHFHHGPLAPWAGAAVDRIAGRSLAARTALAASIALAALEALRRLCRRWMPPTDAALAASLAVALSFFLRPGAWLFPFSFDTAIAVAALTAALALLSGGSGPWRDRLAGACLLAALLSRPELGLAGIAAAALEARKRRAGWLFVAAVPLAAAAAVYSWVSSGIPFQTLVADGWLALLRPPEAFRNVYRAYAGLDRPGLRMAQLGLSAIVLVLAAGYIVLAAALSRAAGNRRRVRTTLEVGAILLLAALALPFQFPPSEWRQALDLVPPLVRVVPAVVLAAALLRIASRIARRPTWDLVPTVSDGALLLAALFASRHLIAAGYSGPYNAFFLPLPVCVSLAALSNTVRRLSPAFGEALPRLSAATVAVFVLLRAASVAAEHRGPGWETLSTPAGSVVVPSVEASTARLVLADLERRLPRRGATLGGFPEAGFFTYTLGAASPLPLEQFWPGHLDAAAEERVAAALERRPPHALLLINALAVGEGSPAFGRDYCRRLSAAVDSHFGSAAVFGPNPRAGARIGDPDFFIDVRVPRRP